MMGAFVQKIVTTCDGCGTIKNETNHWWVLRTVNLIGTMSNQRNANLMIIPFELRTPSTEYNDKEVCGAKCVANFVSKWMTAGTLEGSADDFVTGAHAKTPRTLASDGGISQANRQRDAANIVLPHAR
jgi:hypothetical protein